MSLYIKICLKRICEIFYRFKLGPLSTSFKNLLFIMLADVFPSCMKFEKIIINICSKNDISIDPHTV
jgi:hypothetical protein